MAANEQKPVFGMEGSNNNQDRRTIDEPFPHAAEPYDTKTSGHYPQTQRDYVVGEPWKTGLFDCQQNQTNAIMTTFLPCVTFGQITEIIDEGEMTCPLGSFIYLLMMPALCCQWAMGSKYRGKLRKNFNLVEAPYEDWASHVFCPCCSLCQEFRELQSRGLDPALGWNGILAQRQAIPQAQRDQGHVQYPPQNQAMLK